MVIHKARREAADALRSVFWPLRAVRIYVSV